MKVSSLTVTVLTFGSAISILAGCAGQTRPDLPSDALQVSSGGKIVSFTAPHDGKAYLNDDNDNRVVYSTNLRRDQVMRFDPAIDAVRIDGNTAPEGIANPNHDHSIYFARAAQPDRADNGAASPGNSNNGVPTVRVPIGIQVDVQTQPSPQ